MRCNPTCWRRGKADEGGADRGTERALLAIFAAVGFPLTMVHYALSTSADLPRGPIKMLNESLLIGSFF
ncbi:hypothetical protein WJ0W_003791 [Paenibacillus melissococcoides]|uniref:Uncharacterized protein n=1 Tax=Paenibacillus melissococcoides TaxID=2912268 RepID=A0ABN8U630_9BACL|nr:hypothetical protein WJ0W_003791 [Paenibacillus melissococcoides]